MLEEQLQLLTILLPDRRCLTMTPQCRPLEENYAITFDTKNVTVIAEEKTFTVTAVSLSIKYMYVYVPTS